MTGHLSAALAFALTMLALATIVTVIMEILLRFFRRRNRHLRHMLELVFDQYIAPQIIDATGGLKEDATRAKEEMGEKPWRMLNSVKAFVVHYKKPKVRAILSSLSNRSWKAEKHSDDYTDLERELISAATSIRAKEFSNRMTRSPFRPERYSVWFNALSKFANLMGAGTADEMTRDDFIRRLARDDVGQMLQQQAGVNIHDTVNTIALSFDEVSDAAREYLKNASRVISILIGVVLAFAVNIDGLRIYTDFIEDPSKAARIAKQADNITEAYSEAKERYENALDEDDLTDKKRAAALDQFLAAVETADEGVSGLMSQGISIGWKYHPYCDGDCVDKKFEEVAEKVAWAFSVLITGVLIGLGGPFWYDIVMGLTRVTQIMRGRAPKEAEAEQETVAEKSSRVTETFNVHVKTSGETTEKRRVLKRRLRRLKDKIESKTGSPLPAIDSAAALPSSLHWEKTPSIDEKARTESRFDQYKDAYRQYYVS